MLIKKKYGWKNVRYWIVFTYLQWIHNKIYYRKTHVINRKYIPAPGKPLIIVSNHQNAINDPLAIEFAFRDRIVSIFARGDIFSNKIIGAFLKSLYILPAYRMRTDGYDSVTNNYESFELAYQRLLQGGTVAIFPEGTNQDKRWLGEFSQGYLRMAFGAAEKCNFKEDILILPTANHYENYFHIQSDMMISCGTPISLKPYYELYKNKPRTAQREVNKIVREQVKSLMLNIEDLEHYDAIDYIRESYGKQYAEIYGLRTKCLPEKLQSDQMLIRALDKAYNENKEEMEQLYNIANEIKETTEKFKIKDWVYDDKTSKTCILFEGLGLLILFPIFVYSLIPNILAFYAPKRIVEKFQEKGGAFKMFAGGVQFTINALIVIPISYTISFLVDMSILNWIYAVVHTALLPSLGIFAWYYRIWYIKWRSKRIFLGKKDCYEIKSTMAKRLTLRRRLNKILLTNK